MIIEQPVNSLRYGTDPVAQSLRSVVAAPALRLVHSERADGGISAALDLPRFYPSLYAQRTPRPNVSNAITVLAFRTSVVTAVVVGMLSFMHR